MTEAKAPHVYQAITAVTAAMALDGIGKDRQNKAQNYSFRGIDDVYNALASCLAKNHLCILPKVLSRECSERSSKAGGSMSYVVLDVEFALVSSLDGSSHTIRTVGEAMDSADKATNKAMSAAMKYACLMAFQIPTEGDNDADRSHHEKAESAPARKFESDKATLDGLCLRIDGANSKKVLDAIVNDTRKAYAEKKLSDSDYSHVARAVKSRGEVLSNGNGRSTQREAGED